MGKTTEQTLRKDNKRISRQIGYDIKQGVTNEQFLLLLQQIRNDSAFSNLRMKEGSMERLDAVEKHFMPSKEKIYLWY